MQICQRARLNLGISNALDPVVASCKLAHYVHPGKKPLPKMHNLSGVFENSTDGIRDARGGKTVSQLAIYHSDSLSRSIRGEFDIFVLSDTARKASIE
jgi:hypothetical protein